jgi:HAD superfamily hydrolase (TIGR01509 family)
MEPVEPIAVPPGQFDAYLFDCDGTLANSMPLHFQAWTRAVTERGGVFPENLLYEWGGTPTRHIMEKLNAKFGMTLDVDETVADKERYYIESLSRVQPITPVVERARVALGTIRMAVVSGGRRAIIEKTLVTLGIRDWFERIVCSEDYAKGKPHPDPFLAAAKLLGVAPGRCLVFEDTLTGYQAAEAAGMQYVRVPLQKVDATKG